MRVLRSLAVLLLAAVPLSSPHPGLAQATPPALSTGGVSGAVGGGQAAGAVSIPAPPSPGGLAAPRAAPVAPVVSGSTSTRTLGTSYLSSRRVGRTRMRAVRPAPPPPRMKHHRRLRTRVR